MRFAKLLWTIPLSYMALAVCPAAHAQAAAIREPGTLPASPDVCSGQQIEYKSGSFTSGGRTIRVDQFQPREEGHYPLIVMIHGSGGLFTRTGTEMPSKENFGEMQIACAGYVSLLVHYFDRTGILSTGDAKFMEQESQGWLETLSQALDYASSLPRVDRRHIGLLGESLGGYLALSLAMKDRRIKAVSEYGGGIRLREGDNPQRLPPTLIQHGGADSIVPISEARRLASLLSKNNVAYQIHIYEGLEHYLDKRARAEALARSIQFFNYYLKSK